MKRFLILCLVIFFAIAVSAQNKTGIDVLHYAFRLQLSDVTDTIFGKAEIRILFTETAQRFRLDLAAVEKGLGMTVTSVTSNGMELHSSQQEDDLMVQLAETMKAGDSSVFTITYKGVPADGLIISRNKYGHRTFFADNWPNRGHQWIPCNDIPADKAPVEFIVIAPEHYQVVANGLQVEETNMGNHLKLTHWKEDAPVATKIMVIGVADFAVNLAGMVNCIPVYSWVYPEDREKGFYDYALATEILPFFMKHVGPYGYKKLANVESKTTFGGLENASAIFYSEQSITGTRSKEDLLTHEIAHQWFGDMVTEKSFGHVWLSEGFATYFTTLFFEQKYGSDTAKYMRRKDREDVIAFARENNKPVVDELATDYLALLTANVYQKGGWVLHMLRKEVGDSLFWKAIREYYSTYAGKNADTGDLEQIFEKISGKKLDTFFRQWLYTPGHPRLNISWKAGKSKQLLVTVKQLQPVSFTFPLELQIQCNSGKIIHEKLNISKKEETFVINSAATAARVLADPEINLLFEAN